LSGSLTRARVRARHGGADQQIGASAPPRVITFAARETTARRGGYFDHGAVMHVLFRSNPAQAPRVHAWRRSLAAHHDVS
jgi:hypothetical protein